MFNYILRRIVLSVMLLIVVSILTFGIFFLIPKLANTDPAQLYAGKISTPSALAGIKVKLGFDKPVYEQYWDFFKGIFVGRDFAAGPDVDHCSAPCFGYSFRTDQQVWPLLLDRLPVTVSVAGGAAVIWLTSGGLSGVLAALRKGKISDRLLTISALAGVSMPIFFTGQLALYIFVFQLHWFNAGPYVNLTDDPAGWFSKMFLARVTIAWFQAAGYTRLTRATMIDTLSEDYIRTARAKGLSEPTVIGKHALRSVLTPVVTIFGLDLGGLLGGAILAESVFSLPGLGKLAVGAIAQLDLPIIMGVTLFAAAFIILANFVVDLLYAVIDPRVRLA